MIELVQAGQAGKTSLLFDMHRMRARVFKENMDWDVFVDDNGLEVDQFDLPEAIYLLALDDAGNVVGSWRILPSTGPTMIRYLWPWYLETLPMPSDDRVWEMSRFAVHPVEEDPRAAFRTSRTAVAEMFCALTELCIKTGIREVYTLYDEKIARVIRKIDCHPYKTSAHHPIDGIPCCIGAFKTDAMMLRRIQEKTGIKHSLLEGIELPSYLKDQQKKNNREDIHV